MNEAVPNHNGNGFPHINDPNAAAMMDPSAFMANPGQFNPAQFANQQAQQQQGQQPPTPQQQQMAGMQNGPMRNASPSSFQNPVYQTNPVIPSKRPRPRDDSLAGSPRQNPGMLPTSRSDTPQQQSFPGFQPGAIPQQNTGQFPHLQANGSANASPSPIMGNQMRPGSVPQRVSTASPHPFSPSNQQFGQQASPVPSEHGTPQPNQYMQNMAPGFNPNFAPSPSNPRPSPNPNAMAGAQQLMQQQMGQMPNNMYAQMQQQQQHQQPPQTQQQQHQQMMQQQQQQQQMMQQQQRGQNMTEQQKLAAYQMRLQQQLQGNPQMQAQMQAQNMGRGMMGKQPMPGMPNGQGPPGQGPMRQRPMATPNPEQFMKSLTTFMHAKGLPLDPNPMVGDRPVNLMMLFQVVQNKGGYKNVSAANGWAHMAQALGLPAHVPTVAPTLRQLYERNLFKFEEVWMAQHKQRMMHPNQGTPQKQMPPNQSMNQVQMQQQQQQQQHQQQPPPPNAQHQQQHPQQLQQQQQHQQHPPQQHQTPVKPPHQQPVNGFSTPQQQQHLNQSNTLSGHNRNSLSRDTPGQPEFPTPSPVHGKPGGSMVQVEGQAPTSMAQTGAEQQPAIPQRSDEYQPCLRELFTHGGVDVMTAFALAMDMSRWQPDVPTVAEMGVIDIGALTRSLQSGIHGEVRLALDTLAAVSSSPHQGHFMQLRYCEDLLDALVDCAEEQLDLLAEHTVEVSDETQLTPYEDVVRACRLEQWAVKDMPAYGTEDYELDRAVERLICVTTILRNASFPGEQNDNHVFLADEAIVKFICVVIRYLGTRTMLLRSHANTLDFMKDIVVLLSNIAGTIEVPGREQALTLLQFLLAFAPTPGPHKAGDSLVFSVYEPSLHPYLPHAVDALAKLLARDEPNRTHYKAIYASEASSSPPHDLLNRSFALAISPLPDKVHEGIRPINFPPLVETRKPFLMQGLLAAEILASMTPGPESGVAKSWLLSDNGTGHSLLTLVQKLGRQYEQPPPPANRGAARAPPRKDPELVFIAVTAVSVLKKLTDRARDPNDTSLLAATSGFLPSSQSLLEATSLPSPEWTKEGFLQQLTACFNLGR
jgi:SWI/SNF chromatin-remodeling complex subunit SWI1